MSEAPELRLLYQKLDAKVQQLEALIELGRVLAGRVSPQEVAQTLGLTLAGQLLARSWAVAAAREGRPVLLVARPDKVAKTLKPIAHTILCDPPARLVPHRLSAPDGPLSAAGMVATVPLLSGDTRCGVAALGPRLDGRPYEDDELAFALGLGRQTVVALESAWQAEEATRWRLESEGRVLWNRLDTLARLVLVAASRIGYERPVTESAIFDVLKEAVGPHFLAEQVTGPLAQLIDLGALSRQPDGSVAVENTAILSLPETRKPLIELAKDTMERIGAYRLERRIGAGGMGEVYRAVNVHDGSQAALKLLNPASALEPENRQRLEREHLLVSRLAHPNIVRFLECGEHHGRLYLAMEMLEGTTLKERLKQRPLPLSEAFEVVAQLAEALSALHAQGVVHRDVKSTNIILTPNGRCVLLDFGLAKALSHLNLTASRALVGTLPYMSPERLRGDDAEPPADIWSAGVVLYELLLGTLPWWSNSEFALKLEIVTRSPDLAPITARAGHEVAELLQDMLQPEPEARIPDGATLAARITALGDVAELQTDQEWEVECPTHSPSNATATERSPL